MQGVKPAAFLPLLLRLSVLLLPPPAGAERELSPGSPAAAGAARVALHHLNFQAGSPGALRALGQVRKATLKVGGEAGGSGAAAEERGAVRGRSPGGQARSLKGRWEKYG